MIKIILIAFVFILGFIFCISYKQSDFFVENFDITNKCPNLLVRKGKEIHLVNTQKALIPGVNPIRFESLEDYAQFVKYQQHMKIKCPILYYQETYDTQNNKGFRLHNDPFNVHPGLPSHIAKEYNINNSAILAKSGEYINQKRNENVIKYKVDNTNHLKQIKPLDFTIKHKNYTAPMDPQDQTIGENTNLDNMRMDTNPMDSGWKGHDATDKAIEMGEFNGQKRVKNWLNDELKLRQMACSRQQQ